MVGRLTDVGRSAYFPLMVKAEITDGPADKAGKSADRDENGHFLPGHSIVSPGRPPKPDFHRIVRLRAQREGISEQQGWVDLLDRLWVIALSTDRDRMQAMKILVDQGFGPAERALQVLIEGDGANVTIGPPAPDAAGLRAQVLDLLERGDE